jgi:hypothetical protein
MLSGFCLSSSNPEPVSTLDYYARLANRKGACKGLKTILLNDGNVRLTIERTLVDEVFSSTNRSSQCQQSIGNRNEEFITCTGSIIMERNGIPSDHREIPTHCSLNKVEIVNDSNELKNSIIVTNTSWEAFYGVSCEHSFKDSEQQGKLMTKELIGCEF